jgi:hypothetical protein
MGLDGALDGKARALGGGRGANNAVAVAGAVLNVVLEGTRFAPLLLGFLSLAQIPRESSIAALLLAIPRVLPDGILPERAGKRARR